MAFLNCVALYYPNCIRFLLLQATNLASVPDKIVNHLFEAAVVLNNIVEVILNRHMGHTAHLKLGAGMYLTLKRLEGVICSYLLHGYDDVIIRILKLCVEERSEAEFFCAV